MANSTRTLIETFFPSEELFEEALKEDTDYAPTFKIHYWWKRKLLVIARAVVLGTILPSEHDILDFGELVGLRMNNPPHSHIFDTKQIETLRNEYIKVWGKENPIILDPFAGCGSIPFEAMRVGLKVISNDYNPVAYLIQKATMEYPIKYKNSLYNDVKEGLEWISEETNKELWSCYPKHDNSPTEEYIWTWMVCCPKCGFDNPFLSQWWLENNDKSYICMQPTIENGKLNIEVIEKSSIFERTYLKNYVKCLSCGSEITDKMARKDIAEREEEKLLAVVLAKSEMKEYRSPSTEDLEAFERSKKKINDSLRAWIKNDSVLGIRTLGEKRDIFWSKFYQTLWYKLLNPRQKLVFFKLIENIHKYVKLISNKYDQNYVEALTTYLSFIFGIYIENSCRSIIWQKSNNLITDIFSPKSIATRWTEVNPFGKGPGTIFNINKLILDSIEYSIENLVGKGNLCITNKSIIDIKEKVDIIITDPPYFDDPPYAEMSEIFYTWEREALRGIHNLGDIPKEEEMSLCDDRNKDFFNQLFKASFRKLYECLEDNGLLVIFFPHISLDACNVLISALLEADFRITAAWSIYPKNIAIMMPSSLVPAIIIVARKRIHVQSGYMKREEVDARLKKYAGMQQSGLWA